MERGKRRGESGRLVTVDLHKACISMLNISRKESSKGSTLRRQEIHNELARSSRVCSVLQSSTGMWRGSS